MMRAAFAVGLLVLVGLGIGFGFLMFLTQDQLAQRGSLYETYFSESVQGLEVGSAVRFRGVAVGRVTEIALVGARYAPTDRAARDAAFQLVLVRFALDPRALGQGPPPEEAVEFGLRTRLASQGLTGVAYIELDYVDIRRFPAFQPPWRPQVPLIPSMPSTTIQVQTAAEQLLQHLQELDLRALLDNVNGLIGELRAQLGQGGDAQVALAEAAALLATLRRAAEAADAPALFTELQAAAAAARRLLDSPDLARAIAQGGTAMESLRAAAARLPGTIRELDAGMRSARAATLDLQAEMVPILRDLRAVTAHLREVTEALRRHPGQALLGAPPPPPPPAGSGR
ncbi:MAG: MlaD family protein [Rhodovarius sp.]|nr:MlaD family protein [Rhodovarius sp.]